LSIRPDLNDRLVPQHFRKILLAKGLDLENFVPLSKEEMKAHLDWCFAFTMYTNYESTWVTGSNYFVCYACVGEKMVLWRLGLPLCLDETIEQIFGQFVASSWGVDAMGSSSNPFPPFCLPISLPPGAFYPHSSQIMRASKAEKEPFSFLTTKKKTKNNNKKYGHMLAIRLCVLLPILW
jgi:hypothetical protein